MKITKRQLRRIIREAINEVEFYDETPEGQLVGTEKEDARFTQKLKAESDMEDAGLTKDEISQMWPLIDGTAPDAVWSMFMSSPMYQKLFDWFAFDGPIKMPYSCAKAQDECPDDWILDYLAGESVSGVSGEALPPGLAQSAAK